jgi:D-3-phosphoglycerate dehydrogenase
MPSRVLVSDPISEKGVELLNAHPDITADFKVGLSPEELLSIIGEYDALIVRFPDQSHPRDLRSSYQAKGSGSCRGSASIT